MLAVARALMCGRGCCCSTSRRSVWRPLTREVFESFARIKEEEGMAMLVVEQNANLALEFADTAHVLETGRDRALRSGRRGPPGRVDAPGLPGY